MFKKKLALTLGAALLFIHTASAAYKAGELDAAWESNDDRKLARAALAAISHILNPAQDLFNLNAEAQNLYTVKWSYKDTHGAGLGDLSGSISNVIIDKRQGYTSFDMELNEGYFGGSANVKFSYRLLTPAGQKFFKKYITQ